MPQYGASSLGKLLPRDKIGVMLHLREQDFIAGPDIGVTPAPRHEVNALGSPVREDDFFACRGADELLHLAAGELKQIGALVTQPMNAAMHVGVLALINIDQRLDDLTRSLRRRRVVQIYQRYADSAVRMNSRRKDWKVR